MTWIPFLLVGLLIFSGGVLLGLNLSRRVIDRLRRERDAWLFGPPSGGFLVPPPLEPDVVDRLRTEWADLYRASASRDEPIVLDGDFGDVSGWKEVAPGSVEVSRELLDDSVFADSDTVEAVSRRLAEAAEKEAARAIYGWPAPRRRGPFTPFGEVTVEADEEPDE